MFSSPVEHLEHELKRLDLLLHRESLRLRAGYQLSDDERRGIYISDGQVDALVDEALGGHVPRQPPAEVVADLTRRALEMRARNAARVPPLFPVRRLVVEFGLDPLDFDLILLAIAPELNVKYETVYAYLSDDVTRRLPTVDLALRLFGEPGGALEARSRLAPGSVLVDSGLLQVGPRSPERPGLLAQPITSVPGLANYLLGLGYGDPRLEDATSPGPVVADWGAVPVEPALRERLSALGRRLRDGPSPAPVVVLRGPDGSGRHAAASMLAAEAGLGLLHVDLRACHGAPEAPGRMLAAALLAQRLRRAALFVTGFDTLCADGRACGDAAAAARTLARAPALPVLVAVPAGFDATALLAGRHALVLDFPPVGYDTRLALWRRALAAEGLSCENPVLAGVADRFVLVPSQIRAAVAALASGGFETEGAPPVDATTLSAAARAQCVRQLGGLASRVEAGYTWSDLVLPPATLERIKDVAGAIHHRHKVYAEWGFHRRIPDGRGLKVLLAGPSGTGKTMSAAVIARDLGLDLFRIDLSLVVSKYVGETEKNLGRVFEGARAANAILFFDEADALFGKRSQVKDAQDRYANIEVAYLLQKVEEHDGVVFLATNLSRNIDEAFARRMHYVVEFPLPEPAEREALWRGMFPREVPLAEDVDLSFLARQFAFTGGDIRNVALESAFLAARDGQRVTMRLLVKAVARQLVKQGRVPSPVDFKQHHALLGPGP